MSAAGEDLRLEGTVLSLRAPAKINPFLSVSQMRLENGYHRVNTFLMPLGLYDEITLEVRKKDEMPAGKTLDIHCSPALSCALSESTIYQAIVQMRALLCAGHRSAPRAESCMVPRVAPQDFFDRYGLLVGVEKRIPEKSGLGGGSADAAAVIFGLCKLLGIDPEAKEVLALAADVGADVPFFLVSATPEDRPAKSVYMVGAGDKCQTAYQTLPLSLVLVKPEGAAVSTPLAYELFDKVCPPEKKEDIFLLAYEKALQAAGLVGASSAAPLQKNLDSRDLALFISSMGNNLEPLAYELCPAIQEVRIFLEEQKAVMAQMVAGSGAALYGICSNMEEAEDVAYEARQKGWWAEAASTCTPGLSVL